MDLLTVSNLHKSFPYGFLKRKKILHSVSLAVKKGDVVGFIGLNGAGKSTLINLIMGFSRADSGTIKLFDSSPSNPQVRRNIGYLPEHPYLYENLTGNELIRFFGQILKLDSKTIQHRGKTLLEKLALDNAADNRLKTYSKGMKQRLGLILALLGAPDFYILDEPMSGLDPLGRLMVKNLILEEKEKGKTIFFSSHILNDVELLCDRLEIIRQGKIIFSGTVDELPEPGTDLEQQFIHYHMDLSK